MLEVYREDSLYKAQMFMWLSTFKMEEKISMSKKALGPSSSRTSDNMDEIKALLDSDCLEECPNDSGIIGN